LGAAFGWWRKEAIAGSGGDEEWGSRGERE